MKMDIKEHGTTVAKGAIVGSSMLIPGVSGGTMAIILGIYKRLLHAVGSIRKEFKKSVLFLGEFVLGAGLGFVLFSGIVLSILNRFELPTMYFFIGCVLGGLPLLIKQSEIKKTDTNGKLTAMLAAAVGFAIVISLQFIPKETFIFSSEMSFQTVIMQLITGIIIAIALVLPGISTSHMLLVLGMYTAVMEAAKSPFDNIVFLAVLGISTVIGVFLITKPLEFFMEKFPQITYFAIIGFVAGSVFDVFPGFPKGLDIVACLITIVAGYFAIRYISKFTEE